MKLDLINKSGRRVAGILNKPTDASQIAVIMAHGFARNKNMKVFLELEKLLSIRNISVLRIDLYGHGESEGRLTDLNVSESVQDILAAVRFLKTSGYRNIGLIGSSFGGMASMLAASKSKDIVFLGLRAPVSDFQGVIVLRRFWKILSKLNLHFFADLKTIDFQKATKDINIPTLIVHGTRDRIVPIGQSRNTSKLIANCDLREIEMAGHFFARNKYRKQLVNYLYNFVVEQTG